MLNNIGDDNNNKFHCNCHFLRLDTKSSMRKKGHAVDKQRKKKTERDKNGNRL